jgi:hypothetical protein
MLFLIYFLLEISCSEVNSFCKAKDFNLEIDKCETIENG